MITLRTREAHRETHRYLCSASSVVSDCVTPWTTAQQAPLSMGFSRQEYWSGWPCPPPGGSSQPRGIKTLSLTSPALAGRFFHLSAGPAHTLILVSNPALEPSLSNSSSIRPRVGAHGFQGRSPCVPLCLVKLFFSTSPKTLSLGFNLGPVHRGRAFGINRSKGRISVKDGCSRLVTKM